MPEIGLLTLGTSGRLQRQLGRTFRVDYPRAPREVVVELVKQLGDGVLLRFRTAIDAVNASLDTLEVLAKSPALPTGHAGVDTGPLVVRDGDIFGRTVNRASRLADAAGPNQLVVTAALADELPSGAVRTEPAGDVRLRGISDPVPPGDVDTSGRQTRCRFQSWLGTNHGVTRPDPGSTSTSRFEAAS